MSNTDSAVGRNRAFAAAARHERDHAVLDPTSTVVGDIEPLRSAGAGSPGIAVSGHVYDVVTGLVETVVHSKHLQGVRT